MGRAGEQARDVGLPEDRGGPTDSVKATEVAEEQLAPTVACATRSDVGPRSSRGAEISRSRPGARHRRYAARAAVPAEPDDFVERPAIPNGGMAAGRGVKSSTAARPLRRGEELAHHESHLIGGRWTLVW